MSLEKRRIAKQEEDSMAECLTQKILFEEWLPIIRKLGRPGQVSGVEMVNKLAQLGVFVLAELAVTGKGEKVRASCARDLAHMGGLKPVDRSASVDVHVLAEAEVDALLLSKIEATGLDKILFKLAREENGNDGRTALRSIEVPAVRAEEELPRGSSGCGEVAEGLEAGKLRTT